MNIQKDVTFHPGWYYKNVGINFNRNFFFCPDYRIESDIKMRKYLYERFGHLGFGEKNSSPRPIMGSDLLASGFLYSEILGAKIRFSDNNPPEVISPNFSESDIENLKKIRIEDNSSWKETVKQFEYLENKFGYVESHINLMGIQNIALDLRGNSLLMDYYENPDLVKSFLRHWLCL